MPLSISLSDQSLHSPWFAFRFWGLKKGTPVKDLLELVLLHSVNSYKKDNVLTAAAEVEKEIVVLKRYVQHGKIMTYEGLCLNFILRTRLKLVRDYQLKKTCELQEHVTSKSPPKSNSLVIACKNIDHTYLIDFVGTQPRDNGELALGLELSGQPFLWVVRPNITNSLSEAYPYGFEERVGTRGKIVGWAPQQKVLAHSSIFCFLSHYGWNSTMEATICNEALLEMIRVDYIGDVAYISCTPHLLHHRLCSSDRFLVLSSDGLYQYFSNEEVVSHVAWFLENDPEGDPAQYLIAELPFQAAKKYGQLIIQIRY
ncbi:hypothetical protein GIB67_009688 [Kingdonia uniflora]|uniref:PPM-type phosphatase domain-containing protein n=1 Tax=Kingdonia uniflora TaxID=39325 RepID=A0A7J7LAZ8_9MAGN|nr:hypothetical protein GIB67_009688 [Kingdonia uniflora]